MNFSRMEITAQMHFSEAAAAYMEMRAPENLSGVLSAPRYIRKTTEISYRQYIGTLALFFGEMRMSDIRWFHLQEYQKARLNGNAPFIRRRRPQDAELTACSAKPKKINQELGMLKHLLQRAGSWSNELAELYEPLLDDSEEIPRALSPEQQRLWLDTARLQSRWNVVYWYSLLAFGTCMSTDEIRGLRLGDINLFQRVLSVARKTSKNRYRSRTIELVGADVLWAIEQLLARAGDLGARDPQHYLFPSRVSIGCWNPEVGMSESGIKQHWTEVRQASRLTWFRQYDCRHTAITRLAESGVPTDVIMSRAGHVSEKMRQHYTHISQSAQRRWIEHSSGFRDVAHSSPREAPTPRATYVHVQEKPTKSARGFIGELRALLEQHGLTSEDLSSALAPDGTTQPRFVAGVIPFPGTRKGVL